MTEDDIKESYDRMRQLNPSLPEWDDASSELKRQHTEAYKQVILPTIEKIKSLKKNDKK